MLSVPKQVLNYNITKKVILVTVKCNGKNYTYSCLSDGSFSQFIEINEKFLDSNSIFGDQSLESLFDIKLYVHEVSLFLLSRRMETIHN